MIELLGMINSSYDLQHTSIPFLSQHEFYSLFLKKLIREYAKQDSLQGNKLQHRFCDYLNDLMSYYPTDVADKTKKHFFPKKMNNVSRDGKSSLSYRNNNSSDDNGNRTLDLEAMETFSSTTTNNINITVKSMYRGSTEPKTMYERKKYVWHYDVIINNLSGKNIQVKSRHWQIRDRHNNMYVEVGPRAPGLVGETPVIYPGGQFKYASQSVLETKVGSMEGSFEILVLNLNSDGKLSANNRFDAMIKPFKLESDEYNDDAE